MNLIHMLAASTEKGFWLPKGASNLALDVDWAWNIILWTTGFFFCIVVGVMTFFVIRYRRRAPSDDSTSQVTHNTPLEVVWTAIPLVIVVMFFYVGFKGFANYDNPESNSAIVDVTGQKWFFTFSYPNGATAPDLYCVLDKPVRLNMHSIDVLHGLYLPEFRTQRNLIPWRQTTIWFVPTELSPPPTKTDPGGWAIFCTQYCGNGHSKMFAHVHVLTQADYDEKMKELANPFKKKGEDGKSHWVPYAEVGAKLYKEVGCNSCHSMDPKDSSSTSGTGPPWAGLWKRDHEFAFSNVAGYSLVGADPDEKWDAYLKESILEPDAKLVRFHGKDYHGMTSFAALLSGSEVNEEKRRALIEFIKSLGDSSHPYKPAATPADNADLFDADKHPEFHPESLLGIKARQAGTQSGPAQTGPGN